ncbi:hypothetical protein RJ40_02420 [Methanofollis aquaemaris]|uniref:Uncharacterized protein n=1 Tax=Methanofollis aquaemaris TaxID=126734 RepID=A0A8A3S2Y7_9EURY|nr:hypothetical protein [Methanofollis aquaemaris]QSZ66432.1 hypothetical protein RJ40_02420 [Methanofollis aquaemaris]
MSTRKRNIQISPRLPPSTYDWLKDMVERGEYPNINQAVIAILGECKTNYDIKRIRGKVSDDIEDVKKRLDILESENTALKTELESIKAREEQIDKLTAIVAKYKDIL